MSVTLLYAESQAVLYFLYASFSNNFCGVPSEITLVNSLTFALSTPSSAGNSSQADYNTLINDHQALLEQKKREIERLEKQKAEYEERYKELKVEDDERKFITSNVVKKFHNMAMPKRKQQLPTKKDWSDAFLAAEQHLPAFYAIAQWNKLTDKESKILLLVRMGIKNPGIKIIMGDISDQIVTNTKSSINKKLFDDGKAGTIEHNIKQASRRKD